MRKSLVTLVTLSRFIRQGANKGRQPCGILTFFMLNLHKVIVYLKRLCIFALESNHYNSYCFDKIDLIT